MRKAEVFITWQGREVLAKCDICPADHDVGIMGPYPESVELIDIESGAEIHLTDEEAEKLLESEELCGAIDDKYFGDDW